VKFATLVVLTVLEEIAQHALLVKAVIISKE
jgi:hypothetical protein